MTKGQDDPRALVRPSLRVQSVTGSLPKATALEEGLAVSQMEMG